MTLETKDEYKLRQYIPLKSYSNDLSGDIAYILESRVSRFKSYLDTIPFEQMKSAISDIKSVSSEKNSETQKTRLYIFTDFQRAIFVSLDFPEDEAGYIAETIDNMMSGCPQKFKTVPEFISTIYIFKNCNLFYTRDLYPFEAAEIISRYHSYDLLLHKFL